MTLAEQFYTAYDIIAFDDDYDCLDWNQWAPLLEKICSVAVDESEECPESCDSAVTYRFSDGSALYVANPRQVVYAGFMQVVA